MIIDMNINIVTIASVVTAAVAVLAYAKSIKDRIELTRTNDLVHIDAKLDSLSKRIDEVYVLLVEKIK